MSYTLHKLAPGSYDLDLTGELMGGVVRNGSSATTWRAELLEDSPAGGMPEPFTQPEHRFPNLEAILAWLGGPEIKGERS